MRCLGKAVGFLISPFHWKPRDTNTQEFIDYAGPMLDSAAKDESGEMLQTLESHSKNAYDELQLHFESIERKANLLLYGYIGLNSLFFGRLIAKSGGLKVTSELFCSFTPFEWTLLISFVYLQILGWLNLYKALKVTTSYHLSGKALFRNLTKPKVHKAFVIQHRWTLVLRNRECNNFNATSLSHSQIALPLIMALMAIMSAYWRLI